MSWDATGYSSGIQWDVNICKAVKQDSDLRQHQGRKANISQLLSGKDAAKGDLWPVARPQQPRTRTWPRCDRLELQQGMVLEGHGRGLGI